MKKTILQVLAMTTLIGASFSARAQVHRQVVCNGQVVRVDLSVCPSGRSAAPVPAQVPPPVAAPAPAPVVPPALVAPHSVVVRKPAKQFTLRVGLGLDIFPFDFSLRLSKHLAWTTHFLLFGLGDSDDGLVFGGLLTGLDWYFGRRVFEGLHMGVRAGLFGVHVSGDDDNLKVPMVRAGIGYDWVFEDFVTVGLEGGIHYLHAGGDEDSVHMVFPYLRLSGGFVF